MAPSSVKSPSKRVRLEGMTALECQEAFGYQYVGDGDVIVNPRVVEVLKNTPKTEQRSKEWFEARRSCVTASDIAAVVGENPYKSRAELLKEKVGMVQPFKGNFATYRGTELEAEALDRYVEATGKTVFLIGLRRHPVHKYIAGSPDGITSDGILLEIKCPLRRRINPNNLPVAPIPGYYVPQVQLNASICRCKHIDFVQYRPAENGDDMEFEITSKDADEEWVETHLDDIESFWKDVLFYRQHPHEMVLRDATFMY